MKNVFFFDQELNNQANGVMTYRNELFKYFEKQEFVQLHYVKLIKRNGVATKKIKEGYYIEYELPIAAFSNVNSFTLESLDFFIREMKSYENIILHFNWINNLPLGFYIKQKIECKIVLTKHYIAWRNIIITDYQNFFAMNNVFVTKNKLSPLYGSQILKDNYFLCDELDHIITVTLCAKKSLIRFSKVKEERITTIYNGLNPIGNNSSPNKKAALRRKYGFSLDEKIILYAGNVIKKKGIFDVVKGLEPLYRSVSDFCLVIAGPSNYGQLIKATNKMWSKICVTGTLDKDTLYDFYAMADVGIVPSYVEQCSYTCIEMMHSGLPIIVSDVDGLGEMVNEDCGLKVQVDFKRNGVSLNQKDLIEKLSFLLNNPTKAKRLAVNAKKICFSAFYCPSYGE